MINSVSGISFRGDTSMNVNDLINSPGKFTTNQVRADMPSDEFEPSEKKKSHKGAVLGTIIALLAAAYIGLGVAVHKGAIQKVENPEGIMQKVQNFFRSIGKSADNLWSKIRGKGASKEAPKSETPKTDTPKSE